LISRTTPTRTVDLPDSAGPQTGSDRRALPAFATGVSQDAPV